MCMEREKSFVSWVFSILQDHLSSVPGVFSSRFIFCLWPVKPYGFQLKWRFTLRCWILNEKKLCALKGFSCVDVSLCVQLFSLLERIYSYLLLKMAPNPKHFNLNILCFTENQKCFPLNGHNWSPFLEEMPSPHAPTSLASLCPRVLSVSEGSLLLLHLFPSPCYITALYPSQQNCGGMAVPLPCPTGPTRCHPQSNRLQNAEQLGWSKSQFRAIVLVRL